MISHRFIPAHAGNIHPADRFCLSGPVHPRARGEHNDPAPGASTNTGSSPRTRGTFFLQVRLTACQRFIPAHAGNMRLVRTAPSMIAVHPRARGEHMASWVHDRRSLGSSPRTRGTSPPSRSLRQEIRFIPAHAGNIVCLVVCAWGIPVHPRARGEHRMMTSEAFKKSGSSPRTRGTCQRDPQGCPVGRFIPAHAGNITRQDARSDTHPVHPRARGEHLVDYAPCSTSRGSSPRTRGTFAGQPTFPPRPRFIPAHAGNIDNSAFTFLTMSVHPRARGEHFMTCLPFGYAAGSSPRTRGTSVQSNASPSLWRFIPAHAGNIYRE